ncbi:MAG: hypothetical protein RLY78_246 [Pseudomonadota bacterium]|jgi:uncharacterized protein|uniref:Large ribosomal RNA subunit accumulation protein YceD n=1 Tax=Pseudaquabacterium rugosum TaxID=2984194 RepID=A0ABU9B557_9BURK
MKPRQHDPLRLDMAALAADGAHLEGVWPGAELSRLSDSQTCPEDGALAAVAWSAAGERMAVTGGDAEIWLDLRASTTAWLPCQRCLQPMAWPLHVDRRLRFVRTEAEAEALDAEIEDDVLSLARALDLRELVEDELLLDLPLVPRHEGVCPRPLPVNDTLALPEGLDAESALEAANDAVAEKPNPFAVLAQLRVRKDGDPDDGVS